MKVVAAVMFQGPPLLKVGVSLGPHSIILDPSLKHHSSKQYIFGKNFGLASLSMYTLIILSKHTECFLRLLFFFFSTFKDEFKNLRYVYTA